MKHLVLVLMVIVLAGCGGGGTTSSVGGSGSGGNSVTPTVDPRLDILALAYDDTYTVPANFRQDRSEEILQFRDAEGVERCFDTETKFLTYANKQGVIGGSTDTTQDPYYEVPLQVDNGDGTSREVYARAFKCSVLDRTGVDVAVLDGYGGQISPTMPKEILSVAIVDISEYLYTIRDWNDLTVKVLETSDFEDSNSSTHHIKLVSVLPNGDGSCDTVEVGDWQFRADNYDKTISRSYIVKDQFSAKVVNGQPKVCE